MTDYYLEARGGKTFLRVVTSGFPPDSDWDDWVDATHRGWQFELQGLKLYLEKHRGTPREVVYVRRRVTLPHQDAWKLLMGPDGLGQRPMSGKVFINDPPHQYAAFVDDLNLAILRVSLDPCLGPKGISDVTLFLSTYGVAPERLAHIRKEWAVLLAKLYPNGQAV